MCSQTKQHSTTQYDKQRSKSMKPGGLHQTLDRPHQLSDTKLKIVEQLQIRGYGDTPQQPSMTVKWQQWFLESTRRLLQLLVVCEVFEEFLAIDENVELQSLFQSLLIAWQQTQQSSSRGLTVQIQTTHGSYIIQMEVRWYSPLSWQITIILIRPRQVAWQDVSMAL